MLIFIYHPDKIRGHLEMRRLLHDEFTKDPGLTIVMERFESGSRIIQMSNGDIYRQLHMLKDECVRGLRWDYAFLSSRLHQDKVERYFISTAKDPQNARGNIIYF